MGIRAINVVATPQFINKFKVIKDKCATYFSTYEENAHYHEYIFYGISLKEIFPKLDLVDQYIYKLRLFRNKQEKDDYLTKGPQEANKLIHKYIDCDYPIEPEPEKKNRISDMYNFYVSGTATGRFIELDMNSAEPYVISLICPKIYPSIKKWYDERKRKPANKRKLNCINGCLSITHYSLYTQVNDTLYFLMNCMKAEMEKAGATALSFRRDAILFWVPNDFIIPDTIDIGSDLGQFKIEGDGFGEVTMCGNLNFISTVPEIQSKLTGLEKSTPLQRIKMIGDQIKKKGLFIAEE